MTFSGDLANISLGDVFQNLLGNRSTGTLVVESAGSQRHVLFEDGNVVGFLGAGQALPIAEHLVQRQFVTEADVAKALKRKKAKKTSLRKSLAEMGLVEESDFKASVGELVEERLIDLLGLKHAKFVFEDGKPAPRLFDREQRTAKIALDPSAVLMEGARRQDELSRIQNVIASEQDLFVAVEGWDEVELTDLQFEVAERLDGYTEVSALLQDMPYSRFEILKAIHDIVGLELVRPLSRQELEEMVEDAIAEERLEDAVVLLYRALVIERSNSALRGRLADLLEGLGRTDEAANELAVLGYQESSAGRFDRALAYYDRACNLKPGDIGIQEKRVEIIREQGGDHCRALFEFADHLLGAGLAEKARAVLEEAREGAKPADATLIDTQLAEITAHLGDYEGSAQIYRRLARNVPKKDDERRLELLRKAAVHLPDDEALQKQIDDLESGRLVERRRRRRFLTSLAAMITVLAVIGAMGVIEIVVSHRIIASVEDRLTDIADGRPAAAADELRAVDGLFGWTFSGRRARELRASLLAAHRHGYRQRLDRGEGAELLEELQRVPPETRRSMLEIMASLDDPRLIPVVGRFYLTAEDAEAIRIAETILGAAQRHRVKGHGAQWAELLRELPGLQMGSRDRATKLLGWLRDDG